MAVLNHQLIARQPLAQLAKRSNWAAHNPGVVLVFCIVFIVGVGLICLWIYKFMQKRKDKKVPN